MSFLAGDLDLVGSIVAEEEELVLDMIGKGKRMGKKSEWNEETTGEEWERKKETDDLPRLRTNGVRSFTSRIYQQIPGSKNCSCCS
jgi:hypothetical protein